MPNLVIVGPMGAGKSAIGRALARALGRTFYDTDAVVEERSGVDIAFIFDKEGEPGFRRRERQVVAELVQLEGIVLATGGGVVLDPDNRRDLAACGKVIYLQASIDAQLDRTRVSRRRPLLDAPDPRARLEALMDVREPLYQSIADFVIPTDRLRAPVVVGHILAALDQGHDDS